MARLEVDKARFMTFLDQFVGDVPYQAELIKKLVSQMPKHAADSLIEELYYTKVYAGDAYVMQHYVFKDDINYALNLQGVREFLKSRALDDGDYIDSIDTALIERKAKRNEPICGFYITKGVLTHGERREPGEAKIHY